MYFSLHICTGGGITQYSSTLKTVGEEEADNESDDSDDSDFTDTMSKLTMGADEDDQTFDETILSRHSDFKSVFHETPTHKQSRNASKLVKNKGTIRGTTDIGLPYVMDLWENKTPQNAIGLQVWMMSGSDVTMNTTVRVSTDKKHLIIETPLSSYATEPSHAFHSYLIDDEGRNSTDEEALMRAVLDIHPKTIARKHTIKKLRKHECGNKAIMLKQRIPLPFQVKHLFSTKESDSIFYGKKYVQYYDGSVWLHVELLQDKQDSYKAEFVQPEMVYTHQRTKFQTHTPSSRYSTSSRASKFDDDLSLETERSRKTSTSTKSRSKVGKGNATPKFFSPTSPNPTSLPVQHDTPIVSNIEFPSKVITTARNPFDGRGVMSTLAARAFPTLAKQLTITIPHQASAITDEYSGYATRSKSPKSAKRKPSSQD